MKTYEDMTLEELEENEDDFNEEDEMAIEMYRSVFIYNLDIYMFYWSNSLWHISF